MWRIWQPRLLRDTGGCDTPAGARKFTCSSRRQTVASPDFGHSGGHCTEKQRTGSAQGWRQRLQRLRQGWQGWQQRLVERVSEGRGVGLDGVVASSERCYRAAGTTARRERLSRSYRAAWSATTGEPLSRLQVPANQDLQLLAAGSEHVPEGLGVHLRAWCPGTPTGEAELCRCEPLPPHATAHKALHLL